MRRWALVVAVLYLLTFLVVLWPLALVAFWGDENMEFDPEGPDLKGDWASWAILLAMAVAQASLLLFQVRVESRRPVTRGSLMPAVLAAGFMAALLVLGAAYSVCEAVLGDTGFEGVWGYVPLGLALASWLGWSTLFLRWGRTDPGGVVSRSTRLLFRGSVLEMLIAVPCHVVVRQRDTCCAGLGTGIGLACGTAVMLFSFGPAVLFLFLQRWKRLHPREEPGAGRS
jgi:hypothetical protein